jgi:hypothetical protein
MMCTPDGAGCALAALGGGLSGVAGAGFGDVAHALSAARAAAAYLNSPPARDLQGPARGEALEQLGAITSLLGAAANGLLRRSCPTGRPVLSAPTARPSFAATDHHPQPNPPADTQPRQPRTD